MFGGGFGGKFSIIQDITGTMDTMDITVMPSIVGETTADTCKWMDSAMLTTPEDGEINMISNLWTTSTMFSWDMILIALAPWKDRSFSTPIETFVLQWEWLLLKAIRKFGKPQCSAIKTGMEEWTEWRCLCSSREFRALTMVWVSRGSSTDGIDSFKHNIQIKYFPNGVCIFSEQCPLDYLMNFMMISSFLRLCWYDSEEWDDLLLMCYMAAKDFFPIRQLDN